ncbi:hypothetical protein ODJ79_30275 [Actinoplanes sp. KI2]|uniref:hypothetical protein n=1 Tax=Actinoplanes sp. KI2 TaxID=2983315 RepID=UPI0021D5F9C8|nr:hypothetical protein [Actinoplanes sp. KI2]MCU7728025.1 hypothetical protein [Actinoplanes sp. KI2]
MRMKIVLGSAIAVVLILAGAGYVAVRGLRVNPAPWSLTGLWVSDDRSTWISLRHDGGFTASGISNCIGQVGLVNRGTGQIDQVPDIPYGEGSWNYGPNPDGGSDVLTMQFQKPAPLRLPWFVVGSVEWRFRPVSVTLGIINQSGDADVRRCSLHT